MAGPIFQDTGGMDYKKTTLGVNHGLQKVQNYTQGQFLLVPLGLSGTFGVVQSYYKLSLTKVAWYLRGMKNMYFGSPSDP